MGILSVLRLDRGGTLNQRASSESSCLLSATTLLPGQDKLARFFPMSAKSSFIVSCGVTLSEVGLSELCKPQAVRLGGQSKPLDVKAAEIYERWFDRLRELPSLRCFRRALFARQMPAKQIPICLGASRRQRTRTDHGLRLILITDMISLGSI